MLKTYLAIIYRMLIPKRESYIPHPSPMDATYMGLMVLIVKLPLIMKAVQIVFHHTY